MDGEASIRKHKIMGKKWTEKLLYPLLLSLGISVLVPMHVAAEDFLDRLLERCSMGDTQACSEIDKLTDKYKKQLERLNAQADAFQTEAPSLGVEFNKKPDIRKAYPIILERYMSSDTIEPVHRMRGLKPDLVNICSKHLHDLYFIHGKEVPSLESGKPDWGTIYLVTIDHYFRHCSKQLQYN